MSVRWYCRINDQVLGPLSTEAFRDLARSGQLATNDLVRQETQQKWHAASRVKGLFSDSGSGSSVSGSKSQLLKRAKPLVSDSSGILDAPPPVPAPPVRNVPAGSIPVGTVPTGSVPSGSVPVGSVPTGSVPTGSVPTGSVPQAAPPGPPIPTGAAVANPPMPPNPNFAPAPQHGGPALAETAAEGPTSRSQEYVQRRKNSKGPLIALIACLVMLPIIGVGAAVYALQLAARKTVGMVESELERVGEELEAATSALEPEGSSNGVSIPTRAAAVPDISRWADASRKRFQIGTVGFRVTAAWLESQADQKRVHVEIELSNKSADQDVRYSSWNGSGALGGSAAAMLLLGEKSYQPPLPPSDDPKRIDNHRLAPQDSIRDQLVFAAPAGELKDLKLVLPRAAFGQTGHIGLLLPRVMLLSGSRPASTSPGGATNSQGPVVARQVDPPQPGPKSTPQPPPIVAGSPDAAKPEAPPAGSPPAEKKEEKAELTFDDLLRSIEGDKKEDEKKPGDPPPGAAPDPGSAFKP